MSGPKGPHPSRQELWEGIFLSGGHLGGTTEDKEGLERDQRRGEE
jgi:hypothetical protein